MAYLYLVIAIITEVTGTFSLKASEGFSKLYPSLSATVSFIICFYFFSLAMKYLPLGLSYATWAGLGLILSTVLAVVLFNENLNLTGIIAIVFILIGIVLLNTIGVSK
ncbi:DMT family transporter [Staphylococcus equorum]|uniref:DMT family transporter n=1 Tax=Staphylococcus equorum TaxID=246432 RepID=UPI002552D3FE|nr:multidrug efflux SMR transporter [Staphylococcus equorum]MDK9852130.1 multidrug efflux SMR transporter [Staphylococcus equorum]